MGERLQMAGGDLGGFRIYQNIYFDYVRVIRHQLEFKEAMKNQFCTFPRVHANCSEGSASFHASTRSMVTSGREMKWGWESKCFFTVCSILICARRTNSFSQVKLKIKS